MRVVLGDIEDVRAIPALPAVKDLEARPAGLWGTPEGSARLELGVARANARAVADDAPSGLGARGKQLADGAR